MKRQARTSTRWHTSELGLAFGTPCRKRSVAPQTRRPSSSHSTGRLFSPSRWRLTEVRFTLKLEFLQLCPEYLHGLITAPTLSGFSSLKNKSSYFKPEPSFCLHDDCVQSFVRQLGQLVFNKHSQGESNPTNSNTQKPVKIIQHGNTVGTCLKITVTEQLSFHL